MNLDSYQIITTLLWVMITGASIWIFDNILKRFENVMEDGFKQQARNLNRSIRVNIAIVIICLSTYVYVVYYLDEDLSILEKSGIVGTIFWIFSTIGKFLLHLLAYVVYWGYKAVESDYNITQPVADAQVFIGFTILFSYFVIKRLFFRNVNPLVWAMIVVVIAAGATYLSDQYKFNLEEFTKKRVENVQIDPETTNDSTTVVEEEDQNEGIDDGRPSQYRPEDHLRGSKKYRQIEGLTDDELFPHLESLITAINDFSAEEARTEPQEEDYADNKIAYQQAIVNHIQDMLNSESFDNVKDILNRFTQDGWTKDPRVQIVIQKELCEYYLNYFERFCPDYVTDVPMAN